MSPTGGPRCSQQLGDEWEYHQVDWYSRTDPLSYLFALLRYRRMVRDAKLRNACQSDCFLDLMREYERRRCVQGNTAMAESVPNRLVSRRDREALSVLYVAEMDLLFRWSSGKHGVVGVCRERACD